jgi:hypothetical protein
MRGKIAREIRKSVGGYSSSSKRGYGYVKISKNQKYREYRGKISPIVCTNELRLKTKSLKRRLRELKKDGKVGL